MNQTGPKQFTSLLENAFSNQSVTVKQRNIPDGTDNVVCLIADGEVVATSPFEQLQNSFLLVNTDRYRTGTRSVEESQFPDVLTGLSETEFTVAGYPTSNKEKLLLVVISRFIERLALKTGNGRLDTTFQRLSRIDDEYGTKTMYKWLGESGVETHVYGVADDPTTVADLDVSIHSDNTRAYRRSWVVAFTPDEVSQIDQTEPTHAALVAMETSPNVWRGVWSYDRRRVNRIQSYIKQNL